MIDLPEAAEQVSPLHPGAQRLEELAEGRATELVMAAPFATLERRYVLAQALRALQLNGQLVALAPKQKGGARLRQELESFGCEVEELARRHHRICHTRRPQALKGVHGAGAAGGPQRVAGLGWTQAGLFSWDRLDPGTRLLAQTLPQLSGRGADLGCGAGVIAETVLASPSVDGLALVDLDRRAIDMARRNICDSRASFHWADVRGSLDLGTGPLDFVVTNPPFHDAGAEDMDLGRAFLRRAHGALQTGGALWLVANRHLPYEALLKTLFSSVTLQAEDAGYKVYEARR